MVHQGLPLDYKYRPLSVLKMYFNYHADYDPTNTYQTVETNLKSWKTDQDNIPKVVIKENSFKAIFQTSVYNFLNQFVIKPYLELNSNTQCIPALSINGFVTFVNSLAKMRNMTIFFTCYWI